MIRTQADGHDGLVDDDSSKHGPQGTEASLKSDGQPIKDGMERHGQHQKGNPKTGHTGGTLQVQFAAGCFLVLAREAVVMFFANFITSVRSLCSIYAFLILP